MSSRPIEEEFAVVVAALLAGRIDGQQAVASATAIAAKFITAAQHEAAQSVRHAVDEIGGGWPHDYKNAAFLAAEKYGSAK
jgi:hypothetical protein